MLKQRIVTALLALPLLIVFLIYGPQWLLIPFFMVLVGLGTYEMASMLMPRLEVVFKGGNSEQTGKVPPWMVPTSVLLACLIFLGSSAYSFDGGRGMVLAGMLGSILLGCFLAPDNDTAFARTVGLLVSIVYGSFPWLATWDLFLMGEGSRYLFFLCAVVWMGDTGAYFGGRAWGRHKLAPRMSPKKTWEGALVGIAASLVGGCFINLIYQENLGSWSSIIIASVVGGAFGQMGDLVESTFKRFAGVKDSGVIFPGHGGFLDRVDGLLFAAPIIWFILYNLEG
jgi:phosphatidate cytidylyltransferase